MESPHYEILDADAAAFGLDGEMLDDFVRQGQQDAHDFRSQTLGALLIGKLPTSSPDIEGLFAPGSARANERLEGVIPLGLTLDRLGEARGDQFGGEIVDADAAASGLRGETRCKFCWQRDGHGHLYISSSVRRPVYAGGPEHQRGHSG